MDFVTMKIERDFTREMEILEKHRDEFVKYCEWLASRYNTDNDGTYRIKYNFLYDLLFSPISDISIRSQIWRSFMTSINVVPFTVNSKGNIEFNYF